MAGSEAWDVGTLVLAGLGGTGKSTTYNAAMVGYRGCKIDGCAAEVCARGITVYFSCGDVFAGCLEQIGLVLGCTSVVTKRWEAFFAILVDMVRFGVDKGRFKIATRTPRGHVFFTVRCPPPSPPFLVVYLLIVSLESSVQGLELSLPNQTGGHRGDISHTLLGIL